MRVLIIGSGLIGASVGLALCAHDHDVFVADRVRSHAVVAAGLGAGRIEPPVRELVDVVIVAVPPDVLADCVGAALDRYPNAVVTDVGSVKAPVVTSLDSHKHKGRYVPGHPMSGTQYAGPLSASADLFIDRTWVLTPLPENTIDDVDKVRALVNDCGARLVEMSPLDHDVAVAKMSHVPHVMSILTAGSLDQVPGAHLALAGQGIRDVTRIARSETDLWRQILSANKSALKDQLTQIQLSLNELVTSLDEPARLESLLRRGRDGARSLPGKHGTVQGDYAKVVVEIPDEPRALARLFTDVGDLGVNVEDLSIEHDSTRQVGYLAVHVLTDAAPALSGAIVERGWQLRHA